MDEKTLIPAVLYARKSADERLGPRSSIEAQIEEIQRFAERNRYEIVDKYIDDARKGWEDDRKSLKRMVKEARRKNCRFKVIIVAEWDRLYRSYAQAKMLVEELESNGITLASARGGAVENRNERLGRDFALFIAEVENEIRSGHVLSGQIHWASQGYSVGGAPPYGYKREAVQDSKGCFRIRYAIDQEAAPIVRRIYKQYAAGVCAKEIAEQLNADGIPTPSPKSQRWNEQVWRVLFSRAHQMKYLGCMVFNCTRRFKKKKKAVMKKEDEWIFAPYAHEPILTQELVDAVNEMHKRPERTRGGSRYRRRIQQ